MSRINQQHTFYNYIVNNYKRKVNKRITLVVDTFWERVQFSFENITMRTSTLSTTITIHEYNVKKE